MSREMRTLVGLLAGNMIYAVLVSAVGIFFVQDAFQFVLGVFWSSIGACVIAIHLYFSLQKSLDMAASDAAKRESTQAVIRLLIMIMVVVLGLCLHRWLDPLGVVIGMFALKVSAYVQPFFIGRQ